MRLHNRVHSRNVVDLRQGAASLTEPSRQRRVLMISCAFPPTGGPGVQRSAKFAKYLPQHGWTPIVCAADHMPDLPYDTSLLSDLSDKLAVHRIQLFDPRSRLRAYQTRSGKLTAKLAWWSERLLTRALANAIPDHMLIWALRSYRVCRRIIEDGDNTGQPINAIYSSYSPASNHLLGYWLRCVTGLPWIADFRDLWTDDYCYPHAGRWRKRIDRALEQRFLESADAVIGVTDGQRDVLRAHLPHSPEKFTTITNGADLADFANVNSGVARRKLHGPESNFVLTFTGWFLSDRVSEGLINGIARFGQWTKSQQQRFILRIVGAVSDSMVRRFRDAGVTVDTVGYLPHAEAVEHMAAADALLLLVPEGRNAATLIPGKLFEYLASQRHILLVAPPGESDAANVLAACRTGTRAEHNTDSVFAALQKLWQQWQEGRPLTGCDPEHLEPFTRQQLAGQLADVLSKVCSRRVAH
ncbi:MAG: glycosyltransferase [Phycisphaerales bacterium]|nr:glycosyltransferase [Phycisphaerales bacterium]